MKKLFGVIGDPIGHSMSPEMHNNLFDFYGIDAVYLPFHVSKQNLEAAVKGLKALGVSGFNVTIPHKTTIMDFLDQIDPLAKAIGAVNTVQNENGCLTGYNTDGPGFVKGLESMGADLGSRSALIIGAGGASRAIYFSMAQAGIKQIDLYNRTADRAEELVRTCPFKVRSKVLDRETAEKSLHEYQLIVQTTSIGMFPNLEGLPLSLDQLSQGTIVSDIIYNPLKTKFLEEASKKGAKIQNGVGMFVFQGALAFEKWTGIFPDTETMRRNVLRNLGG
ncbi:MULTISPECIES: shikimate dehydrogenase [Mesobacillus]|uniref:Shikimate dehydrogenase (NADP(+)) n=2 Tax=Mesobacillus TaxID=2675231 RepID=A0A0D6ZBU6_9BACI|nr:MULTISPECIES: shikimate dehydrogenase [Mesobacillus]KIY22088.1 shikimate dehydrogenase [Mesobacillus subterraneus]MDQ0414425.1 shikimate dehydrogenase [Mesobacillus stamsii]